MNWELFAAYLAITLILVLTPGPIVTLVITTGSTRGVRAALVTVAGTSAGNAVLLVAIASGFGRALLMRPSRAKLLGRLSGVTLIGGGIWLSLARRPG
jgi:threonine/homoserine/homoserine lactone efflux protein